MVSPRYVEAKRHLFETQRRGLRSRNNPSGRIPRTISLLRQRGIEPSRAVSRKRIPPGPRILEQPATYVPPFDTSGSDEGDSVREINLAAVARSEAVAL